MPWRHSPGIVRCFQPIRLLVGKNRFLGSLAARDAPIQVDPDIGVLLVRHDADASSTVSAFRTRRDRLCAVLFHVRRMRVVLLSAPRVCPFPDPAHPLSCPIWLRFMEDYSSVLRPRPRVRTSGDLRHKIRSGWLRRKPASGQTRNDRLRCRWKSVDVWLDTQSSPSPLETSLVFCWSAASFCVPQWRAPDTGARAVHKGEERGIR
jgi:hypothetical protein